MPIFTYKKRGYREFLNKSIRLARFASKYQQNIKQEAPANTDPLVDLLVTLLIDLLAQRLPGPE